MDGISRAYEQTTRAAEQQTSRAYEQSSRAAEEQTSRAEAKEGECLVCAAFGRIGIFLSSQDALLEVMLFTHYLPSS